jgi:lipoprotein-anchoring transpeptidase ErfK/SrfK
MNCRSHLFTRILPVFAISVFAIALSSCSSTSKPKGNYSTSFVPDVKPVTNPSALKVKLSTGAGKVYVVEGNDVLLASPASVGTASTPTPKGTFRIYSKTRHRRRFSEPGAGYPMTYWMEFKSAYGMHWGWVKPYPCTHGCVRLPIRTAKAIFDMVPTGTPLIISSSHPEDQTAGKDLPVLDDSALPNPPDSYMMSSQVFTDAENGKVYNF